MLQAARYNVPSSRPRFILMASLPGYQLPTFPQPHNVSPQGFHLPFGSTWYIQGRAAPHHSYTVGDATTDLKLWEWEGTSCNERRPAGKNSIKQYHVKTEAPLTGDDVQFYGSAPLTEFQRRMRKGAPADVHNHVTHCTMNHVPRVCNIPARPDADHKDLPRDLQTPAMQEGKYNHSKERRYRRLDINEVFLACLTKLDPMGMKTRVSKQLFQVASKQ